ncbi:unnamed protein product [Gongylonema pulchrum]|uniref:Large ribosomal subunit protein uL29m n=1 Tax=Gongylonema pulchrum TaxID=637853 RepID=A0A3P6R5W8_9BILA|nr:unnamed protein product [Gongylonema pulchrum]
MFGMARSFCSAKLNTSLPEGIREFFDDPANYGKDELDEKKKPGRSWSTDELRLKSNSDLHKLCMRNLEAVVHERNDAYFRLETGDGADPPMRTVTTFAGFTYQ